MSAGVFEWLGMWWCRDGSPVGPRGSYDIPRTLRPYLCSENTAQLAICTVASGYVPAGFGHSCHGTTFHERSLRRKNIQTAAAAMIKNNTTPAATRPLTAAGLRAVAGVVCTPPGGVGLAEAESEFARALKESVAM